MVCVLHILQLPVQGGFHDCSEDEMTLRKLCNKIVSAFQCKKWKASPLQTIRDKYTPIHEKMFSSLLYCLKLCDEIVSAFHCKKWKGSPLQTIRDKYTPIHEKMFSSLLYCFILLAILSNQRLHALTVCQGQIGVCNCGP